MNFETFISRLEEVRNIGKNENGYSHIVCEIMYYHGLDSEKYMLVDTSTYKRTKENENILGEDVRAVVDFVVTNKTNERDEISRYGCIEVKYDDGDVDVHLFEGLKARLDDTKDKIGYSTAYKNVIYTNGWKWNYYKGDKEDGGKINKAFWEFDFNQPTQKNAETYYELLKKLREIEWASDEK